VTLLGLFGVSRRHLVPPAVIWRSENYAPHVTPLHTSSICWKW